MINIEPVHARKHSPVKSIVKVKDRTALQKPDTMTRVLLVDDNPRVRGAIRRILERDSDLVVIGEASDGAQALELTQTLKPDVLLLDMEMPVMNGPQVAAHLKEQDHPVRILALSAYDDQQYILGMLEYGAAGYLTKDEAPENVVSAVRGIAAGQQGWVSRRVADKILLWKERQDYEQKAITFRELDVLRLLSNKLSDQQIATELGIDLEIVQKYISNLCTKLNAGSRIELILRAEQESNNA